MVLASSVKTAGVGLLLGFMRLFSVGFIDFQVASMSIMSLLDGLDMVLACFNRL